jgi:hypothetical protein
MNMEKTPDYYERLAQEFKKSKEAIDNLTKRQNAMKAELIDAVQTNGYEDNKGHKWFKVGDLELKYERRVSRSFDMDEATAWAKENGHWDAIKEVVEMLSEDKLLGLAWNNKELEEVIQGFYYEKESWAFKA